MFFVDAANPKENGYTLGQITGQSHPPELGGWNITALEWATASAARIPGSLASVFSVTPPPGFVGTGPTTPPYVILNPAFGGATSSQQSGILLHEALHINRQADDVGLAALLGLGGFSDDSAGQAGASKAISQWLLDHKCN
jgi:hypothetical protein